MKHGIIGVVHLGAMPSDPGGKSWSEVYDAAMRDAESLISGGVDSIIVENFGSSPFRKGTAGDRISPHEVAFLANVSRRLKTDFDIPIGVNCLRNDAYSAIGIAAASGLDYIRVNVHSGAYVTDQGIIEGEAAHTLQYRKLLGAEDIKIMADILVKHASPLGPSDPMQVTHDCLRRGHADAVIVTGSGTGHPVSVALLETVAHAAHNDPVFIGSGLTPANSKALAPHADGAIVGTFFKRGGVTTNEVEVDRVRRLVDAAKPLFRQR